MTPEQMEAAQNAIAGALRIGGMTVVDVPPFDSEVMEPPIVVVEFDGNDLCLEVSVL